MKLCKARLIASLGESSKYLQAPERRQQEAFLPGLYNFSDDSIAFLIFTHIACVVMRGSLYTSLHIHLTPRGRV